MDSLTKWALQKARQDKTCYWCGLHGKRDVPATFLLKWQFSEDIGVQLAAACANHMIEKSPYALGLEAL